MWWKAVLSLAMKLGLDTWAKQKAFDIIEKLKKKGAEAIDKKVKSLEDSVVLRIKSVLAIDESGRRVIVRTYPNGDVMTTLVKGMQYKATPKGLVKK